MLSLLTIISLLVVSLPQIISGEEAGTANVNMDLLVAYDETTDSATVTWFPMLPEQDNRFDIICFNQSGESVLTQTALAADRQIVIIQIAQSGFYEVEVQAFDASGTQTEITPRELLILPPPEEATASASTTPEPTASVASQLDMSLVSCDSRNFPFIYLTLRVNDNGQPVNDLTKDNFSVTEDGRPQTDMFDVTPPQAGGGVRMADIVFLIDNSGSMSEHITDVKNNCNAFADSLAVSQIDYRLGLVQFGQYANGGYPRILGTGLMDNVNTFKQLVSTMPADGGYEYGFEAVRLAINTYSFRPGAHKVFILISDEDSEVRTKQATVDLILANDVTVHCAVDCYDGYAQGDYCGAGSIREISGGLLFSVTGNYTEILDTISKNVANTYIVRYRTDNPVKDGVERHVVSNVNDGVSSDFVECTYIPGGAPEIHRTQETLNLHNEPLVAGFSPTISVTVTDVAAPYVQSVTLYARTSGSVLAYEAFIMANQGGDVYAALIPGRLITSPGVDYSVRATDGQVTSSDPTSEPDKNPYQIAVLPNVAPVIEHTPPDSWSTGNDVVLEVHATDSTYYINSMTVKYREQGDLLWQSSTNDVACCQTDVTETIALPVNTWDAEKIEYYIQVTDDRGLSSLWPIGGADEPYLLQSLDWTYAIISDLHIGEKASGGDYAGVGWYDGSTYNLGKTLLNETTLGKSVNDINENVKSRNIKFVVVLGDLTDSAEMSEFDKCIETLDNLTVPWIPLVGNHDTWPYAGEEESAPTWSYNGETVDRDAYFNSKIDSILDNLPSKLAGSSSWVWATPVYEFVRSTIPEIPDTYHYHYFHNFAFDYRDYHFISLDFNAREHAPAISGAMGDSPEADLYTFHDKFKNKATGDWLKQHLKDYIPGNESKGEHIILLAHHPFLSPFARFEADTTIKIDLPPIIASILPPIEFSRFNEQCFGFEQLIFGFNQGELDKVENILDDYKDYILAEFSGHYHPGDAWDAMKGYEKLASYVFTNIDDIREVKTREFYDVDHNSWWNVTDPFHLDDVMFPVITIPANKEINWIQFVRLNKDTDLFDYSVTFSNGAFIVDTDCPIDLIVTDPDGLSVSKSANEITGASYIEEDRDGDDSPDDLIWIPERKLGNYTIQVVPEENADPTATYTLRVSPLEDGFGYSPIVLAENIPISQIPAEPYVFQVKERVRTQLVYTGDPSGQYGDTINLSAILTDGLGNPLAGKTIEFQIGLLVATAVTDVNGVAATTLVLQQSPSLHYHIETDYRGDEDFLPAEDLNEFDIFGTPIIVEAGPDQTTDEGQLVTVSGSFIDTNVSSTHIAGIDWDDGSSMPEVAVTENQGSGSAVNVHTYGDSGVYNAVLVITDGYGALGSDTFMVTVNNVAPVLGTITAPLDPLAVGSVVTASADFNDAGILDTHTAIWDWGDGTISEGTVIEAEGTGSVTGEHTYMVAGVYTIALTLADDDGGVATAEFQYVVIYDADAGFVTGGGWIDSPAGAYSAAPTLTGKANFGFVSRYQNGQSTPDGNTEFQFKAGDLNFHASSYEWLVIAHHKAMYKGTGTINGQGNYGFMISAIDEALTPSTDVDLFRIKIWDKNNGDLVVYDNQMGAAEDADPTTAIQGGSIVIHN